MKRQQNNKTEKKQKKEENRPKQIETLVSSGPILHIIFYNTSKKKKNGEENPQVVNFFFPLFFLSSFMLLLLLLLCVQVFLPTYARDATIGFERVHSTNLELQVVGRNGRWWWCFTIAEWHSRNRIGDICMLLTEGLARIACFLDNFRFILEIYFFIL